MSSLSSTALDEFYVDISDSLPPPVNPTPELRERRLTTAIETFHALHPATAYEAHLAVKIVLCGAHGIDALRLAGVFRDDFAKMSRCRAQAASLMREERAAQRKLDQEQKMRRAVEAVAGSGPARLAIPPAPPPLPAAAPAPQPAPVTAPLSSSAAPPAGAAAAQPAPQPAGETSAPPPSPEAIAEAHAFAEENLSAAAQIRHDRGITPQNQAYYRDVTLPTDPTVIDALVRGTSDVLALLDEVGGEDLDSAA
jgi:hypothetical protein